MRAKMSFHVINVCLYCEKNGFWRALYTMFVPFHVTYMRVEHFEDNMHIKRHILFNELYTTSIKSIFHTANGGWAIVIPSMPICVLFLHRSRKSLIVVYLIQQSFWWNCCSLYFYLCGPLFSMHLNCDIIWITCKTTFVFFSVLYSQFSVVAFFYHFVRHFIPFSHSNQLYQL